MELNTCSTPEDVPLPPLLNAVQSVHVFNLNMDEVMENETKPQNSTTKKKT